MNLSPDQCYEAIKARDPRFDGVFFIGVSTTRVYCRPVCTVRTPGRDRCTFFPNAASAEAAGYRPCLRCRPELAPGSAPTDAVRRVGQLAIARIEAGALCEKRGGVEGLAAEFGLSSRQLRRVVQHEYGTSLVALEQTRRLLLAKRLLTDTPMKIVDIAFASGFGSVRRFNHLFRTRYRMPPGRVRSSRRPRSNRSPRAIAVRDCENGSATHNSARHGSVADIHSLVTLKLAYRPPLAWHALIRFLAGRGAANTERVEGDHYLRVVRIGKQTGWISAAPDPKRNLLRVEMAATLLPVLPRLLAGLRQLFDLDANPEVIRAHLARDRRLTRHVAQTPGVRIPGSLDGFDLALRAVIGQQITVKAATTIYGRLVETLGTPVKTPYPGLDRAAPRAEEIADARLRQLIDRGLIQRRAETVKRLAQAVADGKLKLTKGMDQEQARRLLNSIPGIGPWTIEYIALRVLADPDAFPIADKGLLSALDLRRPSELAAIAEAWRPWRAYAAVHLWNGLT